MTRKHVRDGIFSTSKRVMFITDGCAARGATFPQRMFRSLKFATVMLVLVMLSAPLLSATCFGGEAPAAMHCKMGCPMMMAWADSSAALQLTAHHPGGTCCNVSNGKPSPVAALQAPTTVAMAALRDSSSSPALAPARSAARRQPPDPVRHLESAQSLLCTFLI
jgi:hypothetical protein